VSRYTPRSQTYWRLAAIVKREEPVCWICGHEIDPSLPKDDPGAFNCDHVKSPKTHPELAEVRSNLRASHRRCNNDRNRTKTPSPSALGVYVTVDEF
jgi:5-methylcytosine-specific restriction endonuclease McrA